MEKSAPNSTPTRAAKLKNSPPPPICVSLLWLFSLGQPGDQGEQRVYSKLNASPAQCGAAEKQGGVGVGWGEGGGCSNPPCSPGDCSPGGGHSAPALFCPIRAQDREASSVPGTSASLPSASPRLRGFWNCPGRRETEVFGQSPRPTLSRFSWVSPPPPPATPHLTAPFYCQQLLSGFRGLLLQRDGRRSRCRGKGRQPWPVSSLPRYQSSMSPILCPPQSQRPEVSGGPKARWPRVTVSPASTPLRGRPGQEEVCFSSSPGFHCPRTSF